MGDRAAAARGLLAWARERGTVIYSGVDLGCDDWGGVGVFSTQEISEHTVLISSTLGKSPFLTQATRLWTPVPLAQTAIVRVIVPCADVGGSSGPKLCVFPVNVVS